MMKPTTLLLSALTILTTASSARAITAGQIDTFEDGTTQNWIINLLGMGSPPPEALPANIVTGGPGGADDNFLLLTSVGGGGAGGRLSVINFMGQWSGDYLTAGFGAIRMDVNNLGSSDLSLRLLFGDPGLGPPANVAISQVPILVPAGSGWTSVSFPIGLSDLLALDGKVETALRNATELRIFHSPDAAFPGPPVATQLGVDNIRGVPDTGATWALLAIAACVVGVCKRGR